MYKNSLVACLMLSWVSLANAADVEKLRIELDAVKVEITEAQKQVADYKGGLISSIIQSRIETLLLSKAVLANRIIVEEGGTPTEIVAPVVKPNEVKAAELLSELVVANERIEKARLEAEKTGGLIKALALSTLETERLIQAQLTMSYLQAKYGLNIPNIMAVKQTKKKTDADGDDLRGADDEKSQIEGADERFPNIDYSLPIFTSAIEKDNQISGWWIIKTEKAAIDDSAKVTAINYSRFKKSSYSNDEALIVRCREGDTGFIVVQGDYLIANYNTNKLGITYRFDTQKPVKTNWSELTTNKGTGLFGGKAEGFIRKNFDAKKFFIRITEKNGETHDLTFDLSGSKRAYEAVASACEWSTLNLAKADYKAIQSALLAGGFYQGSTDGVWGAGSKRALKLYQVSKGQDETGILTREIISQIVNGE